MKRFSDELVKNIIKKIMSVKEGIKTTSHRKFNKEILQVKIFLFIILRSPFAEKKTKPFPHFS